MSRAKSTLVFAAGGSSCATAKPASSILLTNAVLSIGIYYIPARSAARYRCILEPMLQRAILPALLLAWTCQAQVKFNRDIRPIMAETCFRCHGPDRSSRMAGMRLDIREEALKPTAAGTVPIVPGDPERSAIVQRVFADGPRIMPPEFSHKTLTQTQKDTIRRWVAEGAKYEGHWAYQPIRRPANGGIDAIIGERLARVGLKPSPEADRRTLIRRVTLDLTGLPPTAAEIAALEKEG